MIKAETKLSRLLPKEHKILEYLSIFWEPIKSYEFKKLIEEMGIKTHDGKSLDSEYISVLENSFIKKRLTRSVESPWGIGFQLFDADLQEFLIKEALGEYWFEGFCEVLKKNFPRDEFASDEYKGKRYHSRLLRDLRISIYQENPTEASEYYNEILELESSGAVSQLLYEIFANPFQEKLLTSFNQDIQNGVISAIITNRFELGESSDEVWQFIDNNGLDNDEINRFKADVFLLQGKFTEAKDILGDKNNYYYGLTRAVINLLAGDFDKSIEQFHYSIASWRDKKGSKDGYPNDWRIFLYSLALYQKDELAFQKFALKYNDYSVKNYASSSVYSAVNALSKYLQNNDKGAMEEAEAIDTASFSGKFLYSLVSSIIPTFEPAVFTDEFLAESEDLGLKWVEFELNNLLNAKGKLEDSESLKKMEEELKIKPLSSLIPQIEPWQRVLNALALINNENLETKEETRIAWRIDFGISDIQPVEQKKNKLGWTKGRKIPLKKINSDELYLSEQDKRVMNSALETNLKNRYYSATYYTFDWEKAISNLVGHPHLYLSGRPNQHIELVKSEPNLIISETENDLELYFDTEFSKEGIIVKKETETLYRVIEVTETHIKVADSIQSEKINIPQKGRKTLINSVKSLTNQISIQSDLEEHIKQYPLIEADNRIYALLTAIDDGFHLEFFVKPFRSSPPYLKPGKGSKSVISELDGVKTQARRNLDEERELLLEIEEQSPFLSGAESLNYEWTLKNKAECLSALYELDVPRKENKLVIEWTKDQKVKLLGNLSGSDVSLNITGANDWFKLTGELKLDDDTVFTFKEIMELLEDSSSNFIEITDGNFIAITEKLRKQLSSLNSLLDEDQKLHKLRSGILEELFDDLEDVKADNLWKQHLEKLEMNRKYQPKISARFKKLLRGYQLDGVYWLLRLAKLGVGACLADDMGLGKTLQALILMDYRAKLGPALVVAPVSVCRNWVNEAKKYTPDLNFHIFGEGDRAELVKSLGKNDVLVTSYSLLQFEEELLTEVDFATITLDEAQAIKNRATKRSKTIMNLKGDFKLITTGTPIENHLLELWNLFNFINPGLLGNHHFFRKKFAIPIQKNNDEDARRTLKTLIKPFILRRRKDEVLKDLPSKTEITHSVVLSEEERNFYESIRLNALEKIESQPTGPSENRFLILAELMKLRLASCNAKLVNKDLDIGSSKMNLFGKILGELIENNHKALVFSQFVKHLELISAYLKRNKIDFHYLDGQTPSHLRQKEIDEFQSDGKAVFLISLKAGGTGLNLTEADYVIHLDPWWNPAVEDQATDRVHRIGQKRPVTVYRLVSEGTVEEKIVKMHKTKRDLADSLLSGTNTSSQLSADDLIDLIKET